jgi:UDP-glucose 4-epimerase
MPGTRKRREPPPRRAGRTLRGKRDFRRSGHGGCRMKVLITGATGGFGKLLVKRLEDDPGVEHIIGLSNEDLDEGYEEEINADEKFGLFKGDIRKKRVEEVFQKHKDIDVLVHLAYDNDPDHEGREVEETNVFGTLRMIQLARKHNVKKFIYKSPTAVYGARSDNPYRLKEDAPLRADRNFVSIRNKIESDMTCQMNMHPGMLPQVVILRFCGILGDSIRSPLNTLFGGKVVPLVAGFDPMFQVIHQDDVTEALARAVLTPGAHGIYNVAGVRTEPLSEVLARMGKTTIPVPEFLLNTFYKTYFLLNSQHSFPFDLNYIKHPFVVDTTRAREELGFTPRVM